MTTIAWDGTTLAADRMGVWSATKRVVCKLFDCGKYHYGCCGSFAECHLVVEWLKAGAKGGRNRLELDDGNVLGIAVRKSDGMAFMVEGKRVVLTELCGPFCATGSGHEYAMAAMSFGKNAIEAIEFASTLDVYTGLGVDSVMIVSK